MLSDATMLEKTTKQSLGELSSSFLLATSSDALVTTQTFHPPSASSKLGESELRLAMEILAELMYSCPGLVPRVKARPTLARAILSIEEKRLLPDSFHVCHRKSL